MTDMDYTEIGLVLDRTGSMGTITKSGTRGGDATAGIRELLKEQAALPGKLTVSITEFDNPGTKPEVKNVVWFVPADHMAVASWPGIMPRGNTPLLDAVGITITDTGARLAVMSEDERPGKVLLVIATDGEENDSRDWTRQQVRDLIEQQQRDYGWRVIYIRARPEAFA